MDQDDLDFLETLKEEFYDEAKEALQSCEGAVLKFEQDKDEEHIKEYMRILHSMKGSSRAVDMNDMAAALHEMESICTDKKDNFVDVTLKSIDKLREYLDVDEASGAPILKEILALVKS
jgi:two-component system chemotaxis sensor kinase CheA